MSNENNTPKGKHAQNQEEEIDLGQLFSLIGKGISNVFNFFKSIFVWVLDTILSFILFLKKNIVILSIATVLGGVIGYVWDNYFSVQKYESSMTVRPNFGSTVQLYKNVDYYESLVSQKDYVKLAEILSVSLEEAESITHIEVNPYRNSNQVLMAYRNFTAGLDTNSIKLLDYDQFKKDLPVESFTSHIVTVYSTDKYVFSKLNDPIIVDIIRNKYYDQVKNTSKANLENKKKALESSLGELNSLKTLYSKILLMESQRSISGTNIYMSENSQEFKEVVVFE